MEIGFDGQRLAIDGDGIFHAAHRSKGGAGVVVGINKIGFWTPSAWRYESTALSYWPRPW